MILKIEENDFNILKQRERSRKLIFPRACSHDASIHVLTLSVSLSDGFHSSYVPFLRLMFHLLFKIYTSCASNILDKDSDIISVSYTRNKI